MVISFPVVVCLAGAVVDLALWVMLGNFKVREKPPASRAGLSIEERQRKITIGRWIVFASGWVLLGGAFLLAWLGKSR
jgi:hypothetical protein